MQLVFSHNPIVMIILYYTDSNHTTCLYTSLPIINIITWGTATVVFFIQFAVEMAIVLANNIFTSFSVQLFASIQDRQWCNHCGIVSYHSDYLLSNAFLFFFIKVRSFWTITLTSYWIEFVTRQTFFLRTNTITEVVIKLFWWDTILGHTAVTVSSWYWI